MRADLEHLDELVRFVAEAVHPLKIILFGSAARGEARTDSDIDIMVVMPEGTHRRRTAQDLHMLLYEAGFPAAVDIVVAVPGDIEKYRDDIGYIYHRVLKEGRELYAA